MQAKKNMFNHAKTSIQASSRTMAYRNATESYESFRFFFFRFTAHLACLILQTTEKEWKLLLNEAAYREQ